MQITAALMAAPLVAGAVSPEPSPTLPQTEVKTGSDQPPASAAPAQPDSQPQAQKPSIQQEFPGIAWGSFLAFPELVLAATYDDNIYGTPRNTVEDGVFTLSPSLVLKSNWKTHALNFDVGGDFDRYMENGDENVNDYWAGFDGRYDISGLSNIFGGARYSRDHEDRSEPGASVQKEPTLFDHSELHLGFATGFDKFRIRAGGTYDDYDFEDGTYFFGGNADNDYRDRKMNSLGARVSYVYSPNYEFFAQYATDNRDYDNNISPSAAFNRGSDGYRVAAGLKFRHPKQPLSGEVFAGHMQQNFDYGGFSEVSVPYFGALVNWRPSPLTAVSGFIDRSLEETNVFLLGTAAPGDEDYASSTVDTTYGFEVQRKLSSRLTVNGRAAYTISNYQGIERDDKIIDAGAGLRYYVTPDAYVGADLRVIDRESDAQQDQYSRNQLMLSFGYTPARKRDYSIIPEEAGAPEVPSISGLFSGFYLGAQIGQGGLTTSTAGPGGESGSGFDEADMGAIGETYGLFAGWGKEYGNWYLGAELDVSDSNANWEHTKKKTNYPTTNLDKDTGYGLSARVGYVLDGGLLYGKLGVVRTTFDTYYGAYQSTSPAYHKDRDEDGVRWGTGLEIPASPNLFVRLDYSYTDYDSYDVPYLDTASTSELDVGDSVFSLGLGWRFGSERPVAAKRLATELRGFYAGASVGHGVLATELSGRQMDRQGTEGPFDFNGDFASPGFTGGFFAGYGHTYDRFYVGLELEAEAANFGWYQEQQRGEAEGGRDFAVEKRGGYGACLRLGYALDNGSLLYGRIGAVRTRFNTIYQKGAGSSAWIDRTDEQSGTRIGLGAEIPAWRDAFVRMDYTYTMYDSYGFVTTHGGGTNSDDMGFDNSESLARLGLGFRF